MGVRVRLHPHHEGAGLAPELCLGSPSGSSQLYAHTRGTGGDKQQKRPSQSQSIETDVLQQCVCELCESTAQASLQLLLTGRVTFLWVFSHQGQ